MNILVISLLRLGDVMMLSPALEGLRRRYPHAKIDLLANKSSSGVRKLLPQIRQVIEFDREGLQEGLINAQHPLFEPYDRLKNLIDQLNENRYQLVVNLTQNKLSGYICALIPAESRVGLTINAAGQPQFSSPWFKYLNDVVGAGAELIFHYSDIFCRGLSLGYQQRDYVFIETPQGKLEAENFFRSAGFKSGPKIVIQSQTSDVKKNWGHRNWQEMIRHILLFVPEAQIILLGAPSEVPCLQDIKSGLETSAHSIDIAILSLEGAFSLLQVCDLLVTGDTSIKHLASASRASILEISLGSSDIRKTGVYKENSLIIKSHERCAPCEHSKPCHREKSFCALSLKPEAIALAAIKFLQKDWTALKTLAEEYSDQMEFYRTAKLALGCWHADNLLTDQFHEKVSSYLDRSAWQFFLENEHVQPLGAYGMEGLKLRTQVETFFQQEESENLRNAIDRMENEILQNEKRLEKILVEVGRRMRSVGVFSSVDFLDENLKEEIRAVESKLGLGHLLTEKMNIDRSTGLYRARQLQGSLNDVVDHQKIKLKLLRSLRGHISEGL